MRKFEITLLGALALLPVPLAAQAPVQQAAATSGTAALTLGDPVLERLIGAALESSPRIRAAGARVDAARSERLEAGLDLAPAITAVGAYSRQRMAGAAFPGASGAVLPDQDVWEAGVRLSWEVDAFGRTRNSLRARGELLDAAEENVAAARIQLAAEVAGAYVRLRGEQDRLEVARRNADNQQRTLELTRERLDGGRGTALDTERARAQLSSTLASIAALEASAAAAGHRISALIGRSATSLLAAGPPAPLALPPELSLPPAEQLVRRRPDLLAAASQLEASRALTTAARSAYLPRLALQGAAGYTASAFNAIGDSGTPRYAVGPVLTWPLLDLGRVKVDVDRAGARQAEARALYEDAVLRAREEIETAQVSYARAMERLGHLEEAAQASERATELARLRFREGATGFLEVLDAERRLLEAQDRLAGGRTEAAVALVNAYHAAAGGGPESR